MRRIAYLVIIFVATIASQARAEDPVYFADPNLKAAVETALGKADPTPTDMLGLSTLVAGKKGIFDLTGLEYATNLNNLNLVVNQISDISALSGLTNLTYLSLYNNQISNISPLSGLTNLNWLFLDENQISNISPLSGLTNLEWLWLEGNQISDISPLSGLSNLEKLDLASNQISDISPLSGLTNLNVLWAGRNQISDISPLAGLTGLMTLSLSDNQISDLSVFSTMSMVLPVGSLFLRENPLNTEAFTVHIPAFETHNPQWLVFYDPPKTLTVSSGAGGTVTDPGIGSFLYTQYVQVSITAVPYTSYHFVEWSGTAVDAAHVADPNAASTTVDMYDDYTLHANFAIDQHTLYPSRKRIRCYARMIWKFSAKRLRKAFACSLTSSKNV